MIVEYRDVIGGRVAHTDFGKQSNGKPYVIELGANWVSSSFLRVRTMNFWVVRLCTLDLEKELWKGKAWSDAGNNLRSKDLSVREAPKIRYGLW